MLLQKETENRPDTKALLSIKIVEEAVHKLPNKIKSIDSEIKDKIINQIDPFVREYPNFEINNKKHYKLLVVKDVFKRLSPFDWAHNY